MRDLASHVLTKAPARFALGGLSMGGYVAYEIMRLAPERVTRLVTMGSPAHADTPEQRQRRLALLQLARSGKFKGVTPRLLPLLLHPDHLNNPAVTQPILDMAARVGPQGFERQQTAMMHRIDSRPHLRLISCPTLIIAGAQDQLFPLPGCPGNRFAHSEGAAGDYRTMRAFAAA
ncbi:MAG: alpha/beta hydrolase [Alphaproteobacteria bacterium]